MNIETDTAFNNMVNEGNLRAEIFVNFLNNRISQGREILYAQDEETEVIDFCGYICKAAPIAIIEHDTVTLLTDEQNQISFSIFAKDIKIFEPICKILDYEAQKIFVVKILYSLAARAKLFPYIQSLSRVDDKSKKASILYLLYEPLNPQSRRIHGILERQVV